MGTVVAIGGINLVAMIIREAYCEPGNLNLEIEYAANAETTIVRKVTAPERTIVFHTQWNRGLETNTR